MRTTKPIGAILPCDDHRSLRDKDSYLARIVASGEKTIVYVNSRMGSVDLTRHLRRMVPQVAMQVGFYNAGLSRRGTFAHRTSFSRGCSARFGVHVSFRRGH